MKYWSVQKSGVQYVRRLRGSNRLGWPRFLGLLSIIGSMGLFGLYPVQGSVAAATTHVQVDYGQLPLHFEPNHGQTDAQVQFLARGRGSTLFLTGQEAVLVLRPAAASTSRHTAGAAPKQVDGQNLQAPKAAVLRLQLLGASPQPHVVGLEELPGKVHYFRGNDPTRWRTNVPVYAKVKYEGIYPGVDLIYYGHQRQLEYDFVVAPGADPTTITLSFQGADHLEVDSEGDLVLQTATGSIRLQKPVIYQEVDGVRREIAGGYVSKAEGQVGFQVAAYDASRPLVIDPVLFYAT